MAIDPESAALVERLLGITLQFLRSARNESGFPFRLDGSRTESGSWQLRPSGTSIRYTAIATLGLAQFPAQIQCDVLAGDTCRDLTSKLSHQIAETCNLGDVALVCWAAAQSRIEELPPIVTRLAALASRRQEIPVVELAWAVSALVAAREKVDVESCLQQLSRRLLTARGATVFPHVVDGKSGWHRAHVGSFADQVYPLQALARLHRSSADLEALSVAETVADAVCKSQGPAGQWWWHYDARTGNPVEGYPVYSVHQHAMAPMALLDLADAGGTDHLDAICRGLRWLARPPETAESLVLCNPPTTWRKVARSDPAKVVRGMRAAATAIHPGIRLGLLDKAFPPGEIDHECRPYELGWLPLAWLS